jgi:hypothetical protein
VYYEVTQSNNCDAEYQAELDSFNGLNIGMGVTGYPIKYYRTIRQATAYLDSLPPYQQIPSIPALQPREFLQVVPSGLSTANCPQITVYGVDVNFSGQPSQIPLDPA